MARKHLMRSTVLAICLLGLGGTGLGCWRAFLPAIADAGPLPNTGSAATARAADGWRRVGTETRRPATLCSAASLIIATTAAAAAAVATASRARVGGTTLRYTTQTILPAWTWLKTGFSKTDLGPGDLKVICLAGVDVCVGRTTDGKLFALGDKAPPTGISFSAGAEVQGDAIIEPQYGNAFDVFTGLPKGDWCPSPPVIGAAIGAFTGGPTAIAVFQIRETLFGSDVEVLVDTNLKKAFEADYWKGLLDAQGKDDGSYY